MRAHILHPEHIDQQLRQLIRAPRHGLGPPRRLLLPALPGNHRVLMRDRPQHV
jgi:hypothetical protein